MAKKKKEPKELKTLKDLDEAGIDYKIVKTESQQAQESFWNKVKELYPDVKTDELSAVKESQFNIMCDNIIHEWRLENDTPYGKKHGL